MMEHVPARVSERQDHIGLSDDTGSEQIHYSDGCIRVHAQLDQGHGASKRALMLCFILLFIFYIDFFFFLLVCLKEESSQ